MFFHCLAKKERTLQSLPASYPLGFPHVVLDVETTGLNPKTDKIIQLSAIRYNTNGEPSDYLNTYVNPHCPVPIRASRINNISDSMLCNAPSIDSLKESFLGLIQGATLIGYNVAFDLNFLSSAFGEAIAGSQYIDILPVARAVLSMESYKLENVSAYLGICFKDSFHNAFTDCKAVAALTAHFGELITDNPLYYTSEYHIKEPRVEQYQPHRSFSNNRFSVRAICPSYDGIDNMAVLYGKTIVFTGELSIARYDAAQMAANVGATVKSAVSRKTDYLVVGRQDISLVGNDGMSTKEEAAYALNAEGKAHINIIDEAEFLSLLRQRKSEDEPMPDLNQLNLFDSLPDAPLVSYGDAKEVICDILSAKENYLENTEFTLNASSLAISFFEKGSSTRSMWIVTGKKRCKLEVKESYRYEIDSIADQLDSITAASNHRYAFPFTDLDGLRAHAQIILDVYDYCERKTKGRLFDCCHRFKECSDAKNCIHPDQDFARSCSYRKKLKRGIIFYGENRNV